MSAANYTVNFGYKAQDGYYYGPNGKVGKYHRGNDRPCPSGTPIIISGVTIGLTGATGLVSGPHLHTQACTAGRNYADDFDPGPYEFKNGTVVSAGWHSQFGNHIVIRVGGVDITYAHLSKINVSVGQTITSPSGAGGNNVFQNDQEVKEAYLMLRGNEGSAAERKGWIGQSKQRFFQVGLAEANAVRAAKASAEAKVKSLTTDVNSLKDTVAQLKTQVASVTNRVSELTNAIKIKDDEIAKLKAEVAAGGNGEDSVQLNALGAALKWLITRLGLKG